jgi:LacI family transcriptional regulator
MDPSVTLLDVAHRASVSLATASRVINGSTRVVGEGYRERVLEAAAQMGYTPNTQAQAVARGSSQVVGLLVHDVTDPYFSTIAAGVLAVTDQQRLIVSLGTAFGDPVRELEYVSLLRAQRARSIILIGSRTTDTSSTAALAAQLGAFVSGGGRAACIGQNKLGVDSVVPENAAGARRLAEHVLSLGHRDVAVLAGPSDLLTARDRANGFRRALADAGMDLAQVVHGPFTWEGGYEATVAVVASRPLATCILAVNDVMAMGALAALRDANIPVPQEISVAGFDDVPTLRDVTPTLTTVHLPMMEMGRRAAELAFAGERSVAPRVIRIRGEVVARASTAAPRRLSRSG